MNREQFIAYVVSLGRKEMLKLARKWGFTTHELSDQRIAEALWNLKQRADRGRKTEDL